MRDVVPCGVIGFCLVMAGCFDVGPSDFKLDFCDAQFLPGEQACVSPSHPFKFLADHDRAIAIGGVTQVQYLAFEGKRFELRSNDPNVLRVEPDGAGGFVQRGLAEGVAVLQAIDPDSMSAGSKPGPRVFDSVAVTVAPIDTVQFTFGPDSPPPLDRLAALPGSTERLQILPRSSGGTVLAGAESQITFAFTGGVAAGELARAESRIGRFEFLSYARTVGFATAVRFDSLGSATMTALVNGSVRGTLPIEVIAAADQVSIQLASLRTFTQAIEVAGLVGTDARGVPVAGLIADFTATPPELAKIVDPHGGEALISTLAPGIVTVTATLPERVLTAQFIIEAR